MEKIFYITIVLTTLLASCLSASVSYNQIGDIKISYDGKTFLCDKITCPESTERCIVTKKTVGDDRSHVERWSKCLTKDNKVLLEDRKQEENPIPNSNVDIYVEHGMHGTVYNDPETQRIVNETLQELERNLQLMQQNLANQFKQLENIFSYN